MGDGSTQLAVRKKKKRNRKLSTVNRSTIMKTFQSISVLAIAIALSLPTAVHAQNPPMNCTPDGIIEVCTLADTTSAPVAQAVAPATPVSPVPRVTYKDGQLTITAENVPLNVILHEVSRATGATLEVPPGSAREPVFVNIGPGSVRDVLVKLLNGTKFNYVMTGSQDTSSGLQKLVLTPADQSTEVAQNTEVAPAQVETPNWPPQSSPSRPGQNAATGPAGPQDQNAIMQASREKVLKLIMARLHQPPPDSQPDPPSVEPAGQASASPSESGAASANPAPAPDPSAPAAPAETAVQ